eukprot:5724836-Alexandrium_andersonii.AAC.1
MSASLVGSEMCIRDSFRCVHAVATVAQGKAIDASTLHNGCEASVGWGAVSYTHLTLPTICSV